ncbi:hypothetical protein BSKO_03863 [Bryopsis sp. KO-2023]|nr:hypothetical protein BSKO_03863 [Bryopsis sp. KO-2023]
MSFSKAMIRSLPTQRCLRGRGLLSRAAPTVTPSVGRAKSDVPSETHAKSRADFFAEDKRPIILFDGVCNFCNAGVDFVMKWDSNKVFRLGALQSESGKALLESCGRRSEDISSMVVVESDDFHVQSDAALRIAEELSLPLPLASYMLGPVPKDIRDGWYDFVGKNRYNILGMRDTCRLPDSTNIDRFV